MRSTKNGYGGEDRKVNDNDDEDDGCLKQQCSGNNNDDEDDGCCERLGAAKHKQTPSAFGKLLRHPIYRHSMSTNKNNICCGPNVSYQPGVLCLLVYVYGYGSLNV